VAGDPRLFVAIEIDEDAKARLRTVLDPWKKRFPAARWVPPANWHVTLTFLGPTSAELQGWVDAQVAAVASSSSPFRVTLAGLGAFPSVKRAKVMWSGLDDPQNGCAELAQGLRRALSTEFEIDRRPFRPHLTVARADPPLKLPEDFAATPLLRDPFVVNSLILFQSIPATGAPRYEPVGVHPFSGEVLATEHVFE
jgi:2'-5' RNA ligase